MATLSTFTTAATVPDLWDKAVEALKEKDKENVDFQRGDKRAILIDVLGEVERKKRMCISRRLKYKRSNGESVHLYDVFEKMVKWVNKFKEVGDTVVQYDPGHAALPWAAIRFLLQASVNDVQIFGNLAEGLELVCKTVARYAAIEKLYFRQPSSVDKMLEDSIIATYASILRFLSKCRRYFDLGLTQRFARSITQLQDSVNKRLKGIAENDKRVSELTMIVDAERSQLTHAQQLSARNELDHLVHDLRDLRTESTDSTSKLEVLLMSFKEPLVRITEQTSTLSRSLVNDKVKSQMKKERLNILLWLSNVQYRKHHQNISKGLLEGTGSWLFGKPQFIEWRNSSVSSVLWLHGIPGSGKTCLMSTVIRQLRIEGSKYKNAAPIAYFYCQRNTAEPQRSDPTEVLRAILKQLLCYNLQWQKDSSTAVAYRERKTEADEDGSEVSRLDILEATKQIIEIASTMPVTILVDALDECRSDQRHKLLQALDILLADSAHLVKVFISSRDDVDIVLRLQWHPNIYISIDDNKDDINRFIRAGVQKAQSDGRLLKGQVSSELQTFIIKTLAMKAGGMFLWVNLQIENLCDSHRIKIAGDLVDELDRLPRSLAGMYSLILEKISQIEHRGRTIAETILRWLLCTYDARSHVTIAACSGTVSTEHRSLSIPDILDVCSNLVVYDGASDNFRFAHSSVREFLESQPGYTPSESNRSILQRLFQKMTYDQPSRDHSWSYNQPSESLKSQPGYNPSESNRSILKRLFQFQKLTYRPPRRDHFWSYATLNWVLHYHRLEEQQRKEVFELHAKRFLFNGPGCSDVFSIWATEVHKLDARLRESAHEAEEEEGSLDEIPSDPSLPPGHSPVEAIGNFFFENIRSPVDLASCFGWLEILDHLNTNQSPADFHCSAMEIMHVAIRFGQTSVVRWLVDLKFTPTDEHLELGFRSQRSEIVQSFLDKGFLSTNTLLNGHEILVLAVRFGLCDIYRNLIKKGANIHCRDQNGRTLLFHAVSSSINNSEIVEDLLLTGIDPTAQDNSGQTPLSLSIWREHQAASYLLPVVRLSRSSAMEGEDVLWRVELSSEYRTACLLLHYGLYSMLDDVDMRAEWMELLTRIGRFSRVLHDTPASAAERCANLVNDTEHEMQLAGQTLLSLAALFRHEKAFRVLLDSGIDPSCPAIREFRKKTSTVAQIGQSLGKQELSDPNTQTNSTRMSDELRQGPLAWAAYTGNLSLVQSILDRGMDPNLRNRKGQTALYFAVQQTKDRHLRIDLETKKEAIVRLLLQNGALITCANTYSGAVLLEHAFKAGYSNVAKLLLEHGAEIPSCAMAEPTEQLWVAFDQGQEGIRQALLERIRGAQVDSLDLQSSSYSRWSGDPLGIAARLVLGGTMRVLGDVVPTASGDVDEST